MREAEFALVHLLVERFDALRPLFREHISDFDELLPHVFFDDITRYVVARKIEEEQSTGELAAAIGQELHDLLDTLERAYSEGEGAVTELIAVSFLENLPRIGEPGDAVRGQVGPLMKEQLNIFEKWSESP